MIKAICFDLDGVYFTEKGKKAFHNALVKMVGDEDKVVHFLYKSEEMSKFCSGKLSEEDFWQRGREYLGLDLSDGEFRQLWVREYEIDKQVRGVVLKAKEKGYIASICSNNNPARIKALEQRFGFLRDFDVAVFSYQEGVFKPDKKIFQALINKAGVKAEEIVYSDDNPERIQGARDLGMTAFVYKDFSQFLDELKKIGVDLTSNSNA